MQPAEILSIAMQISASPLAAAEKRAAFRGAFPAFAERYPKLFEQACSPGFRADHLKFMIEQMLAIRGSEVSTGAATSNVMRRMTETYVEPLVAAARAAGRDPSVTATATANAPDSPDSPDAPTDSPDSPDSPDAP